LRLISLVRPVEIISTRPTRVVVLRHLVAPAGELLRRLRDNHAKNDKLALPSGSGPSREDHDVTIRRRPMLRGRRFDG
jgi:hypothetical protein